MFLILRLPLTCPAFPRCSSAGMPQDPVRPFVKDQSPSSCLFSIQPPVCFCSGKLPFNHTSKGGELMLRVVLPALHGSSPGWWCWVPEAHGRPGCETKGTAAAWLQVEGRVQSCVLVPVACMSAGPSPGNAGKLSVIQIRATTSLPSAHPQHTARALSQEASAKSCTNSKRPRNSKFSRGRS